jgi:hypothetical protein
MTMADAYLFLGKKTRIDASGNIDFHDAFLRSDGYDLVNEQRLTTVINVLTDNVQWVKTNLKDDQIDSITELVTQAVGIQATYDAAVSNINNALSTETSARLSGDNTLTSSLSTAMSTETSARMSGDASLTSSLSTETSARMSGDASLTSALSSEVSTLNIALSTEKSERIVGDASVTSALTSALTSSLSTEKSERLVGDASVTSALSTALSISISTEKSERLIGDASVTSALTSALTSSLSTEKSERLVGDASLTSSLSSETSARMSGDASLTSALSTETSERLSGDASLTSSLSSETSARMSGDASLTSSLSTAISTEASMRVLADKVLKELAVSSTVIVPVSKTSDVVSSILYPTKIEPIAKELTGNKLNNKIFLNYNGWYYKNTVLNEKINWHIPFSKGLKVKDINVLYMNFLCTYLPGAASDGNDGPGVDFSPPKITIYTKVENGNSNYNSYYRSIYNYMLADINQTFYNHLAYQLILMKDNSSPTRLASDHEQVYMLLEDSYGPRDNEEEISAIVVSSPSYLYSGNFEFILSNFSIQTPDGTNSFIFNNGDVYSKYTSKKLDDMYKYFFNNALNNTEFILEPAGNQEPDPVVSGNN